MAMPSGLPGEPTLSVVIATRDGYADIARNLHALVPQVNEVGGEIIVVCGNGEQVPVDPPVTWITVGDPNIFRLRQLALDASRAPVIAVGEDHAAPTPGWCEAVLRAHAEHPEAAAVIGCLVNRTDATVVGRANFLAFAAPFVPPMPELPSRPPPISTLSFKRAVLKERGGYTGSVESSLIPRLFAYGAMAVDDRIAVGHWQDNGMWWSIRNAYMNTRGNYGNARTELGRRQRRAVVRWILTKMFRRQIGEAWAGRMMARSPADLTAAAILCAATTVGALVGTLRGPGKAAEIVA
jgi:hypothetical protein